MSNPIVIQYKTNEGTTPPQTQVNGISTQFNSLTAAGNVIVAFYTVSDFAGIHTNLSASDTQLNTFAFQNQANTSLSGGAESTALLVAAAITGDTSTADIVKTSLSAIGDVEDFQAAFILEIGQTGPRNPIVGQSANVQNGLASGTNNIVSGNIVISSTQVPCLMVAMAGNSSGGGTAPNTPTIGTGMTLVTNCWGFGGTDYVSCVATQLITTPGTYQAIFNQASNISADIFCNAVCIQGAVLAQLLMGQICI